jgi:signal transduction histidine kinase
MVRRALAWAWLGLAVLACSPAPLAPQVVPPSWNQPVEVRVAPAFRAAVLPVTGRGAQWDRAMWNLDWQVRRTGLTPAGPVFVRWLTDAAYVPDERMRWEVGVPIQPSDQVWPPLEPRDFGEQLVASTRTRAPVDEAHRQWRGLVEWIVANGYQPLGAWMLVLHRPGGSTQELELRIPVFRASPFLEVFRALVCVTGLALSALLLFSRLRGWLRGLRARGGGLWVLVGASCVVMYLKPLLDDLIYLYGGFFPEGAQAWISALRGAEYVGICLVAPLLAHLLFRLVMPQLPSRWAFRAVLGALYASALLSPVTAVLGFAPAWLARAEWTWMGGARTATAALLVVAMLGAARVRGADDGDGLAADGGRAERGALLALAMVTLGAWAAGWIPDPVARAVSELVAWAIPMTALVLLSCFRERAAMVDVLAKRGVFVLAALLALAAYFAFVPGRLWRPLMGWKGGWVFPVSALPFVILAPWLSSWLSARLDRLWLGRALSPAQAQRFFLAGVGGATSEEELLRNAEERLASIFPLFQGSDPRRRRVEISLGAALPSPGPPPPEEFQAPVVSQGVRVGTMRIAAPPSGRPFLSEDQALFGSLGEALGLALEALRLRERKLAQERTEQELRVLTSRAELRALRAQINPHFVFNALNAIAELVATDPATAERTVERLAEVLRHALRRSEAEWVRVDEELAMVRAYLEVERIRFGKRLELLVEIGEGAAAALLPTLMVQTVVENAVKHGIAPHPNPARVEVRASRTGDTLRVEVRDTGPGFAPGDPSPASGAGLGLKNVQARLAGYFGAAGSLRVERDEEAGMTVVSLSIPAVLEPLRAAP